MKILERLRLGQSDPIYKYPDSKLQEELKIEILTWGERVEILRRLLFVYREQKGKLQGLMKVLEKKGKMTQGIREYLTNLDDIRLLKRFLTKH